MEAFINSLCARQGITIDWRDRCRAYSWRKTRRIRIQHIRKPEHFAIALHEIGHLLGANSGPRLVKEYQAWAWAVENCPAEYLDEHFWFTLHQKCPAEYLDEHFWFTLHHALRWYVEWAKARQYRTNSRPVIPPKNHPMWALLAKAKEGF